MAGCGAHHERDDVADTYDGSDAAPSEVDAGVMDAGALRGTLRLTAPGWDIDLAFDFVKCGYLATSCLC